MGSELVRSAGSIHIALAAAIHRRELWCTGSRVTSVCSSKTSANARPLVESSPSSCPAKLARRASWASPDMKVSRSSRSRRRVTRQTMQARVTPSAQMSTALPAAHTRCAVSLLISGARHPCL
eukprot:3891615-Rhodomonas_salina.1